jgi:hypothetical protein
MILVRTNHPYLRVGHHNFWNRYLHNILWGFSHEIKELLCKCLFSVMCYLVCFMLLVQMTFIHKPYLP